MAPTIQSRLVKPVWLAAEYLNPSGPQWAIAIRVAPGRSAPGPGCRATPGPVQSDRRKPSAAGAKARAERTRRLGRQHAPGGDRLLELREQAPRRGIGAQGLE